MMKIADSEFLPPWSLEHLRSSVAIAWKTGFEALRLQQVSQIATAIRSTKQGLAYDL